MTTHKLTIEHNGNTYFGEIGTVIKTELGLHEHYRVMTADLTIDHGAQRTSRVGGWTLGNESRGTAFGMSHVIEILKTVGVDTWEELKGHDLVVVRDSADEWRAANVGIANIRDASKVLIFEEHAAPFRDTAGRAS